MIELPPAIAKPCDDCRAPAEYVPFIVNGNDLMGTVPHLCDKCAQERQERDEEEARQSRLFERRRIWEKIVPEKYRETDTSSPEFNKPLWHYVRSQHVEKSMALIGPAGRCKTRVFALLAARAINLELSVGWCPANAFQWASQTKFDDEEGRDARAWLKKWRRCDVLFIDDLGKQKWTESVESEFFYLLEERSSENRPTHWSMNPDPSDIITDQSLAADPVGILARALDPSGAASKRARFAPIVSRLLDNTTLIAVP
jgi:hypothetical protein